MLFMGPQMVLDLFAQFKQSLEQVTEALVLQSLLPAPQHSALCYQRLQHNATRDGPWLWSCERRQQQHLGAATSQGAQSTQHFAKPEP